MLALFIATLVTIGALLVKRTRFLAALISLEVVMLIFVVLIPTNASLMGLTAGLCIPVLLVMGACEAALGLSLLVVIVRHYGNDKIRSLSLQKKS